MGRCCVLSGGSGPFDFLGGVRGPGLASISPSESTFLAQSDTGRMNAILFPLRLFWVPECRGRAYAAHNVFFGAYRRWLEGAMPEGVGR